MFIIERIKKPLERLSFKETFIWPFFVGNLSLGFVFAFFRDILKHTIFRSLTIYLFIVIGLIYIFLSLALLFKKSETLDNKNKTIAKAFLYFYLVLCIGSFLINALSPLTFVGGQLYDLLVYQTTNFSFIPTVILFYLSQLGAQ